MAKKKRERDLTKFWKREHVPSTDVSLANMTAVVDGVTRSIKVAQNLGDGYYLVGYVDEHRKIKHSDSPTGNVIERNKEGNL